MERARAAQAQCDELVEVIHRDNKKLMIDALATEVLPALMALPDYLKQGRRLVKGAERTRRLMFNKLSRLEYRPYGVIGIISPWNYPFAIPFSEVVMALLAGNAVLLKVASDEEAVRMANASVWSRNRRYARTLARRVCAGAVMINDHLMSHGLAETPWGGCGDSGLGRTHGEVGFREMLRAQVIVDDILPAVRRDIFWHPYSQEVFKGLHALVDLLAGTLTSRIKALPGVLKIFLRYWF